MSFGRCFCGAFVCFRICCNKEHLAIFYLSNKQRHGGRVKCLRRSSRVFARKPGLKNGKEAIFEALSGVPLPLHCRGSTALTQRQRLRRPSNPCRAWGCKSFLLYHFTLWLIRPSVPVRTAPVWNFVARTRVSAFRPFLWTCTVSKASHSYTAAFD